MATSTAKATVTLDPKPFEDGAKAVISASNKMASVVVGAFATAGVAILAAFGAKTLSGIVNTLHETLQFGEAMANAGKKAGRAAGQFYLLNSAIEKGIGLKTAAKLLGQNADVLDRSANLFRDVSIKLWAVGERIRGFWLGLLEKLSPVLSRLLDGALAINLVQAGQAFGESIAKSLAVIYQLAEDKKLWDTFKLGFEIVFAYAAEKFLWLADIGNQIFSEMFSDSVSKGIADGLSAAWDDVGKFFEHFGDGLDKAVESIAKPIDKFEDTLKKGVSKFFFGEDDAQDRKNVISNYAPTDPNSPSLAQAQPENPVSFADKIKEILGKNEFNPSTDLAENIDKFSKTVADAFAKYNTKAKDDPAQTFENNSRRGTFGVSSLAATGQGGNVYVGLTVLDVNRQQLDQLRQINQKLGPRPAAPNHSGVTHSVVPRQQTQPVVTQ